MQMSPQNVNVPTGLLQLGNRLHEQELKGVFDSYAAVRRSDRELTEVLVHAAGRGFGTLVKLLLEYCMVRDVGGIVNPDAAKGSCGYSGTEPALVAASRNGSIEVVNLLLQYKADPNNSWDNDDNAPLQIAVEIPSVDLVDALLRVGAKADT